MKQTLNRHGSLKPSGHGRKRIFIAIAAVLILAVSGAVLFSTGLLDTSAIAIPKYPDKQDHAALDDAFLNGLQKFSFQSSSAVLSGENGGNQLYSPLSLYMALALTAGSSAGNTRNEILNAVSMRDIGMTKVSEQTAVLFRDCFFNDEFGRLSLANSLWLNHYVKFNKPFLKNAAKQYYAQRSASISVPTKPLKKLTTGFRKTREGNWTIRPLNKPSRTGT